MGFVHDRPRWEAGEHDWPERRGGAQAAGWALAFRDRSALRAGGVVANASAKVSRIGWIGAGRMGYAMAERLAKGGADITVWNRTRSKAEPLATYGAKVARNLAELADCEIVFCMVSTWDDVKEVVAGSGGLLSGEQGKVPRMLIECSSISLEGSAELRSILAERGIEYLAAP